MIRSLSVYAVAIVLIFGLCFAFYQAGYHDGSKKGEVKIASMENSLTKWVFNKSTKISEATARVIVKEALKTSKPLLVLAVAATESEFSPTATSTAGAVGVMQVMARYHAKALISAKIIKEARDLYDIAPSIKAGSFIMENLLRETNGNVTRALDKYLGVPDGFYVRKIQANLSDLYSLVQT